ncbi:MAG TPA: hypothetical protein VIW29_22125 [Polyangiaceae bacterium]
MRVANLILLASAALGAVACSDGRNGESMVSGGAAAGSDATGVSGSGGRASGGTGITLGGSLNVAATDAGGDSGNGELPDLPSEVNVIITADNAYGFGYGTKSELKNYFGGVENPGSSDIFDCPVGHGPEAYVVPADDANIGGYLYIVGYADKNTTQGVIAKFFREGGMPVFTGTGKWEACATGEDYDPGSGGPDRDSIDAFIKRCNAGDLPSDTSSVGWVTTAAGPNGKLAFGEDNSTTRDRPMPGNEFLEVCDIDPTAKWMWFDWEAERADGSPFMWPGGGANVTKDYVIFRLGAEQIPRRPPQ